MTNIFKNLFKRNRKVTTFYMIDDNTVMPIACDSYEKAVEIVNNEFNGELDRIYKVNR
jgi:hypothetical protein